MVNNPDAVSQSYTPACAKPRVICWHFVPYSIVFYDLCSVFWLYFSVRNVSACHAFGAVSHICGLPNQIKRCKGKQNFSHYLVETKLFLTFVL